MQCYYCSSTEKVSHYRWLITGYNVIGNALGQAWLCESCACITGVGRFKTNDKYSKPI